MSETTAEPPVSASLATLLRPAADLTASIHVVLAEQQRLASHIDELNAKLVAATSNNAADARVLQKVDAYVAKLRAAKRRVATLQTSLDATKSRLTRVHGYVKAQANVLERENGNLEAGIEAALKPQPPADA